MRRLFITFIAFNSVLLGRGYAQTPAFDPTGYWTGAITKEASVLPITVEIEREKDGYEARTTFPDWIYYVPRVRETVTVEGQRVVIADLLDGDAEMFADIRFGQLFGTVGDEGDSRRIHLKRMPPPPEPTLTQKEVAFHSADGTKIAGLLILPGTGEVTAGMVMVRGRGCASRTASRAAFFARYGMAVLTYDKRGAGASGGDCETFTLSDLTSDAIAALEWLAADERVDPDRVGFFGESAGAWTVQAAAERQMADERATKPAFIVTWVGPATSILRQQISSATTYGASIGLTEPQQELLVQATLIIADDHLSDDEAYDRLTVIRERAADEGWLNRGFGPDDLPRARTEMASLWLRRFRYDPATFLANLGDLSYLAVFGAEDPIVPIDENVSAIEGIGSDVTIVSLPASGHSYDFDGQQVALPNGETRWVFEGPDAGFSAETIAFLRERGFMTW